MIDLDAVFENSVQLLSKHQLLELSILYEDGTTIASKKAGDNLGYSAKAF